MIGFFKFLVGITDIANVVCLIFFLFIVSFCFAFYGQVSDIDIDFMAGNKSQKILPLRTYETMPEFYFKKVFKKQYLLHSEKICST